MAVVLRALGLFLVIQGCCSSPGSTDTGCMRWTQRGVDVCCEACHPGNHLVRRCGPKPSELCAPCETGTFTVKPKDLRCLRCTQCEEAQVLVRECTATSDTQCGCKDGLICGDDSCSFCIKKCVKGEEPTKNRSCRPCPDGTFNDQIHQKCKPWSTRCPDVNQKIVGRGNALSNIQCINVSRSTMPTDQSEQAWPLVLCVVTSVALSAFTIIVGILFVRLLKKRKGEKKPKKTITKSPITRDSTDDPRTLIAIECSFHEAQQEQGSSSELLVSKDSKEQLIH